MLVHSNKSFPVCHVPLKGFSLWLTVWNMTNRGKLLERWEYQTILPVSWESCVGQEATVRTLYKTDLFKIKQGLWQSCLLSPCLFNLYAEYIMRNAGLDELQAGIRIDGRNISNLSYADDTTLKGRNRRGTEENGRAGLRLNIKKN